MENHSFGKKIATLQKQHGITKTALADILGVSVNTLSSWEKGETSPSFDAICNLCSALSLDDFAFGSGTQKAEKELSNGLQSIRQMYKIGRGPSSSHTMGPEKICRIFKKKNPDVDKFKVILYGSLALTGRGHGTDRIVKETLSPIDTTVEFDFAKTDLPHPNTMELFAYKDDKLCDSMLACSIGGGEVTIKGMKMAESKPIYEFSTFKDIAEHCRKNDIRIWEYVEKTEGSDIWDFLGEVWDCMRDCIKDGLNTEGILPGGLGVSRKAGFLFRQNHIDESPETRENRIVCAYAYAVGEQNAAGGRIVTAPTCGASGVLPAVMLYFQKKRGYSDREIEQALATAAIIGLLVKTNASISGAECGCQAEIGTASAMGAAALCYLGGGDAQAVCHAAAIAIKAMLGLVCDPIAGLVEVPCVKRNAAGAVIAMSSADMALAGIRSAVPPDEVILAMREVGDKMDVSLKETGVGGVAGTPFGQKIAEKMGMA